MKLKICLAILGLFAASFSACASQTSNEEQLKKNLDTLTINISLNPFKSGEKDPGGGLRSVLLHTPPPKNIARFMEPPGQWPDGTFVSADAKITRQKMLQVVSELKNLKLLKQPERFYSHARANPKSARPAGKNRDFYQPVHPSCIITATFTSGDYHSYVIYTVAFGEETIKTINRMKQQIPDSLTEELLKTYKHFQSEPTKPLLRTRSTFLPRAFGVSARC